MRKRGLSRSRFSYSAALVQRTTCKPALLSMVIAFLTPIQYANADTAGSGACEQTFTVSGTGVVSVFQSGGFCFVAFKNTGALNSQTIFTWTRPAQVTSVDALVVGGGGGGGSRHGGGGGAGGFVQADSYAISSVSTISVAGKVRFFVGGKRISTCKERTTSGTYPNNTATCTWRPAVTGRQVLTATLTPTDNTFSASTSARTEVFVAKRGTTR